MLLKKYLKYCITNISIMKNRREFEVNDVVNMIVITEDENNLIKTLIKDYGNKQNQEQFKKLFNTEISRTVMFGSTDDVTISSLRSIIPTVNYRLMPRHESGSYRCYANENPSIILHENVESSWNCLMQVSGRPQYVLIYKK